MLQKQLLNITCVNEKAARRRICSYAVLLYLNDNRPNQNYRARNQRVADASPDLAARARRVDWGFYGKRHLDNASVGERSDFGTSAQHEHILMVAF